MQNLSQHIEYLITRNDCVILPGFGAFIAENRSAEFDRENGIFTPPYRTISFNSAVVSDDGLIAHSIARKNRISFEEGRKILDQRIKILRDALSAGNEVSIGKLGSLSKTDEDRILFSSSPLMRQKSCRSGFAAIPLPSVIGKEGPSDSAHKRVKISSETAVSSPDRERYYYIRIPKVLVKVAASIVIVMCALLSLIVPTSNTERTTFKASVVDIESLFKTNETNQSTLNSPLPTQIEEPEVPKCEVEKTNDSFFLIVGTFATEEKANRFIDAHSDDNLRIVGDSKRLVRVAIQSADSSQKLREQLNNRDFRNAYPGAWIWESK